MNLMRRYHLLLGCFFAPALLFFTFTGAFQTLLLHKDVKNGYQAPEILKVLAKIHKKQTLTEGPTPSSAWPLRGFVLLMSAGFIFSTSAGLAIAFQFFRPRWVLWALLSAGGIVPLAFLLLE